MDYGNGTESEWAGPVNSGDVVGFNCSWDKGTYKIRVKAKDIHGNEGEWSDNLKINVKDTLSKSVNSFNLFSRLSEKYPLLFRIILYLKYLKYDYSI